MITREKCNELLEKYITTPWLKFHMRESDLIMQAVARRLNEDPEKWGLSGLLHDLDFDYVNKDPQWHVIKFDEILEKEGLKVGIDIDDDVYHAIRSHYEEHPDIPEKRESNLDYALSASENLSGFLVACALVQPDKKIASVEVESVTKKLKKKDFAKAVRRDLIQDIEKVGISLEEFIKIALDVMKANASELGL